jgi:small basic protein
MTIVDLRQDKFFPPGALVSVRTGLMLRMSRYLATTVVLSNRLFQTAAVIMEYTCTYTVSVPHPLRLQWNRRVMHSYIAFFLSSSMLLVVYGVLSSSEIHSSLCDTFAIAILARTSRIWCHVTKKFTSNTSHAATHIFISRGSRSRPTDHLVLV